MQLKHTGLWLLMVITGTVFGWKVWQQHTASDTLPAQLDGPAVILFRGDNSPNCQAVHQLIDQAEARYGKQINFVQTDWSSDNLLIKKYRIRFLPTVVFIDHKGKETGRIIGESPAVQQKLEQALTQVEQLLRP